MIKAKIVLDTRRRNKDGNYYIKVRVTQIRTQKYYSTGFSATKEEYNKIMNGKCTKLQKEVKAQLEYMELKAKNIIQKLEPFSFTKFKQEFYSIPKAQKTLVEFFNEAIDEKNSLGSISTASSYKCTLASLESFKPNISFETITPRLLKEYELWVLQQGLSISTVGVYLRTLRAIYNKAISDKVVNQDNYPFGAKKYTIPQPTNPKRTLNNEELKKIFSYKPIDPDSYEARSLDFWKLSYLANGMNFKDIILLKKTDCNDDFIHFMRAKTKRSTPTATEVPILPATQAIIDKWKDTSDSEFLFPYLTKGMTPKEVYTTVHQFIKMSNKHMKAICKKLGIKKEVTTYWARHSFSRAMMDSGQPIMYISKCLNHSNIKTTQSYLNSFEDYNKHSISQNALLNFG